VREVQVEIDGAGTGQGVARRTRRTIVDDAIVIVIRASSNVHGLTGVEREGGAEGEEAGGLAGKPAGRIVQAVIVGASPVGGGIVAVGGEEG